MAGASVTSEPISELVPSGSVDPKPVRSIFVAMLPTPDPLRCSLLEWAPVENLENAELIGLVQWVDRGICLNESVDLVSRNACFAISPRGNVRNSCTCGEWRSV